MSARDQIWKILQAEAEEKARAVEEQARQQAEAVLARAEHQAETERQRALDRLARRLAVERAKRLGEAEKIRKDRILVAQHEVIQTVMEKAREKVQQVRRDEARYVQTLKKLITEALEGLSPQEVVLKYPPEDEAAVHKALKELNLSLPTQPSEEIRSGVIVEDPSRGFAVYNTLEGRMERVRELLLERFSEVLMG